MTITELIQQYNFHDSSIESVQYNASDRKLDVTIDFCFWMQPDYKEGMPETGMVQLIFNDVQEFMGKSGNYNDVTILDIIVSENNKLTFQIIDEDNKEYMELIVIAESAEIVVQ